MYCGIGKLLYFTSFNLCSKVWALVFLFIGFYWELVWVYSFLLRTWLDCSFHNALLVPTIFLFYIMKCCLAFAKKEKKLFHWVVS